MFPQCGFVFASSSSLHFLSKSHFSSFTQKGTRLTKQACLLYLQNCRSMKHLKQIQSQIFRVGLHQSKDALNKLMVFCADPTTGNLVYAERIFSYIKEPDLFIYNLMIRAFTKQGNLRKAISFFGRLRDDGLSPDNFTYPFVLKAVGCLRLVPEGEKIRGCIVKMGLDLDLYVRNSLMDMYAEMGNIQSSRLLFEEMPERNVVSWNILISGYVKNRRFKDAVDVFRHMRRENNVRPDEATLVSTLSACAASKDLELGKEIQCYIGKELKSTTVLGNALLDMFSKCGCSSVAQEIFDRMPDKNLISWTSMISGLLNIGRLDEAIELFEQCPTRDVILWTAMINGYMQFNRFDEAFALFREMQLKKFKPDRFTVVALLTGCAKLGALEQGKWIHEYIEKSMIGIDTFVGTALIDMYAKCGCIEKSMEIFRGLNKRDTALWTATISGLALNGQTNKALDLFSEMKQAGEKPDEVTFIGVLSACNHGGLVEEGRWYFDSMRKVYRIEPKLEHYGCMVDLLGRAGLLDEAEEMIEEIPDDKSEIMVPLWGALLSACRINKNVEMGERVANGLVGIEASNSGAHTLLANIYAVADRWEDVSKVRRKMKDLGIRKVPGCSSIEVNGMVHEFLVGDSSNLEIKEVISVLNDFAELVKCFD